MRGFLLDQNVPAQLTFAPSLPVIAAAALGLGENPTDTILWNHARQNRLVIVPKDGDFIQRDDLRDSAAVGRSSALWKSATP